MRLGIALTAFFAANAIAHGQLFAGERALVRRYGRVVAEGTAGPYELFGEKRPSRQLHFLHDGWQITALLWPRVCYRTWYQKSNPQPWTEDEINGVLAQNSSSLTGPWNEQAPSGFPRKRNWLRQDKATAEWTADGMKITAPPPPPPVRSPPSRKKPDPKPY